MSLYLAEEDPIVVTPSHDYHDEVLKKRKKPKGKKTRQRHQEHWLPPDEEYPPPRSSSSRRQRPSAGNDSDTYRSKSSNRRRRTSAQLKDEQAHKSSSSPRRRRTRTRPSHEEDDHEMAKRNVSDFDLEDPAATTTTTSSSTRSRSRATSKSTSPKKKRDSTSTPKKKRDSTSTPKKKRDSTVTPKKKRPPLPTADQSIMTGQSTRELDELHTTSQRSSSRPSKPQQEKGVESRTKKKRSSKSTLSSKRKPKSKPHDKKSKRKPVDEQTADLKKSAPRQSDIDKDDLLKLKMKYADELAMERLATQHKQHVATAPNNNKKTAASTEAMDKDDLLKQKMKYADELTMARLAPQQHATSSSSSRARGSTSTLEEDDLLKRKMDEAKHIAMTHLSVSSNDGSSADYGGFDDGKSSISSASMYSIPAAAAAPRRLTPLQPSMQRSSKIRVTPAGTELTPGAYAIAGFNAANTSRSSLIPEEEDVVDELSNAHDEEVGLTLSRQVSSEDIVSSNHDERNSLLVPSNGEATSFKELLSQQSSKELMEAQVSLMQEVFDNEDILDSNNTTDNSVEQDEAKQQKRRRRFRLLALVFLIIPLVVLVSLVLVRRNKNSNDSQDDDNPKNEPQVNLPETMSPTSTPAPTLGKVPITVVLWLDNAPKETSWDLQCNSVVVFSAPVGAYFQMPQEVITETVFVQEGATCRFSIFDSAADGLCCRAGNGFYQIYLADQDDVPVGFVAEGGDFLAEEVVFFEAKRVEE